MGARRDSSDVHRLANCRLDIPKAPLLLGQLLGNATVEASFKGAELHQVCHPVEDTEARRELLLHVLKTVQVTQLTLTDAHTSQPLIEVQKVLQTHVLQQVSQDSVYKQMFAMEWALCFLFVSMCKNC